VLRLGFLRKARIHPANIHNFWKTRPYFRERRIIGIEILLLLGLEDQRCLVFVCNVECARATRGKIGVLGEEGEARARQLVALLVEVRGVVPLEGVHGDSAGHATEGDSYESSLLAHLACTHKRRQYNLRCRSSYSLTSMHVFVHISH